MQKSILAAKRIAADINADSQDILFEVNLLRIFEPVFTMGFDVKTTNQIIAYIIYAYDNHSGWIEISQDRWTNKQRILHGLGIDENSSPFHEIYTGNHAEINDVIATYVQEITTWEWLTIMTQIEYHSKMLRYVNSEIVQRRVSVTGEDGESSEEVESMREDMIAKINQNKADILSKAVKAREEADNLLAKIRRDFVKTDTAVQADFGFSITDEKKIDIYSWRQYIRQDFRNKKPAMDAEKKSRLLIK